ncbi:hypothetical protein GGR51DRAFT_540807 [Nemania sp. FL0031]|nr:hypothetical protein GGR51DRAFT_540807 [Nemania sp. FL0031]
MHGLGHGVSGDPFSGNVTGAFTNAASVDPSTRQRSDANTGYLKPIQDRKNLVVITGAHVQTFSMVVHQTLLLRGYSISTTEKRRPQTLMPGEKLSFPQEP